MLTAILLSALALDGTAPEWVHLVPAGTFKGADGRGPWKLVDPAAVITASMQSERLAIDENHSIDLATKSGQPSPARGWIVAMEARADGIWGRVEWTPDGTELLTQKAYRGISPVFEHKDGVVVRVLRAALTNTPNLTELATLNTQETGMDLSKLRQALGLPETADEAAILAAVTANAQTIAANSAQISAIATAAGLDATTKPDAIVTVLQTQAAAAGDASKLAAKVVTLETELNTMKATGAKAAAVAFVDGAIKAGKPINALRDHYIARHVADAAGVEKEINAMVSINAGGIVVHNAAGDNDGDEATPHERQVAAKMGVDPKKLVEQRKKREGSSDGRTA
jgi:phage I-like protein